MIQVFVLLYSMGIFGAILIVLGIAALFIVSATTCALFMDLFSDLGHPLNFEGYEGLIFILAVAIALIVLSSLGPVCNVIGKAFIVAQFVFIITSMINLFLEIFDRFPTVPFAIVTTIISLIIGWRSTDDFLDFLSDSPILSILSGIPASFFIFVYIWLMKEEFSKVKDMVVLAKESLVITLICFAVFTAIEVFILVKNKKGL